MTNARTPILRIKDNAVFANSRDVADYFGKRHDNVLRAIETLNCSPEFTRLNFEASDCVNAKGDARLSFDITKDGFTILASIFTGPNDYKRTIDFVLKFIELERTINQSAPKLLSYREALLALADKVSENERIEAEKKAAEVKYESGLTTYWKRNPRLMYFALALDGINTMKFAAYLRDAGYLCKVGDRYRVHPEHRHLFTERRNRRTRKVNIYVSEKGRILLMDLWNKGKLPMRAGFNHAPGTWFS